jgi:tetratricopeptide (TPR) repeat protein
VTAETTDKPYTLRSLEEMLGLSRSVISGLISAGFVSPARGPRNEYRFSFQDVVLLRTAHHLRSANIPPRRLLRSLKQLRERLPDELPLSGLRIRAIGNDVAVHEGGAPWEVESGQLLMDFEVTPAPGAVSFLQRPAAGPPVAAAPDEWFARGEELEAEDDTAAEAAYRRALALDPDFVDAYINLGALLCEAGRCSEAVALYDDAIARSPDIATLHFNRAIALEDRRRDAEALQSYDRCLALEPDFADAHYNAARLHEKLGHAQRALRHYSAYRRLQPGD